MRGRAGGGYQAAFDGHGMAWHCRCDSGVLRYSQYDTIAWTGNGVHDTSTPQDHDAAPKAEQTRHPFILHALTAYSENSSATEKGVFGVRSTVAECDFQSIFLYSRVCNGHRTKEEEEGKTKQVWVCNAILWFFHGRKTKGCWCSLRVEGKEKQIRTCNSCKQGNKEARQRNSAGRFDNSTSEESSE